MINNFLNATLGTVNINKVLLGNRLSWVRTQGLAKDYPGTGWYKATDTGTVFNKDVPEGETYIFKGDPVEYISVWKNGGFDPETFMGTLEDAQKLVDWYKNLHRYATSNITDMSYWMFGYGASVEGFIALGISPDDIPTGPVHISHYDTSSVTNMSSMFEIAVTFNQPLDNFDTSNVITMESMFNGAMTFNQDISAWDVSNVTDMRRMFKGAESFNQPLDSFDTSNVTKVESMFAGATSFNQDISHWDTSKVTDIKYIFIERPQEL